jgi:hypothetical protein
MVTNCFLEDIPRQIAALKGYLEAQFVVLKQAMTDVGELRTDD